MSIDLPLGVLTTLAVLTCALAFGHIRDVSQRRIAEEKGLVLLKQWLSPAQLAQYEKSNYFEVTGGDSGKRYRIRSTRQMNVDELDERGLRSVQCRAVVRKRSCSYGKISWRRRSDHHARVEYRRSDRAHDRTRGRFQMATAQ